MTWMRHNGKILKDDGKIAIAEDCCCGGCCCGRVLSSILWIKMFNVPVFDPMAGQYSSCCADGVKMPMFRCQGQSNCDNPPLPPSVWMSDAAGNVWCSNPTRLWWAELSCAIPTGGDPTSAGLILKVAVSNCTWSYSTMFTCDNSITNGQSLGFDAATSTCTPLFLDFDRTGGGSPIDNPNDCCDDNTTVGSIRFEVTETEPT